MDTFTTIWQRLLARTGGGVDPGLAQDWVKDAFNVLCDRRQWSWRRKYSAIYPPAFSITDTCTVTSNSNIITGVSGVFTPQMEGKQFRVSGVTSQFPTYTIQQYVSPTVILLDSPWIGPTASGQGYVVFQCWFPMPSDFASFYSLVNSTSSYQLWTQGSMADIERCDPQRVNIGESYMAALYDYTKSFVGVIGRLYQVSGTFSDPQPISTSTYGFSYPSDLTYLIRISTGGTVGGALVMEYSIPELNLNTWTSVPVIDSNPIDLGFNAQVYFPAGTYTVSNYYTFTAKSETSAGVPRFEFWPRPVNVQYVYPSIYIAKIPALSDSSPNLPPFVSQRGDILLKMAEAEAARYPGTSTTRNPLYDLAGARYLDAKVEVLLSNLELRDDEIAPEDFKYTQLPYRGPIPLLDGRYIATHGVFVS